VLSPRAKLVEYVVKRLTADQTDYAERYPADAEEGDTEVQPHLHASDADDSVPC